MSLDHCTAKDAPIGHWLHHPHEVSLCTRDDKYFDSKKGFTLRCWFCHLEVDDHFYACKSCQPSDYFFNYYILHKSCGDFPLQINHSFHPIPHHNHQTHFDLVNEDTSVTSRYYWCFSCYRPFGSGLFYECGQCDIHMDVECAFMPTKEAQTNSFRHFSHPHPMLLVEQATTRCAICESAEFPSQAYGCAHCKYFIHKSCAEFPRELSRHSLHPDHGNLSMGFISRFTCRVCKKDKEKRIFYFECDNRKCGFVVCFKCVKHRIKYEDHDHLLCYVDEDEAKKIDHCNAYDAYCTRPDLINIVGNSEEFKRTESSMFRCSDCDFSLHFLCGPLPSTIKHDCHIHSLTLLDSLVEDDFGEYYCDVCETQRDPRIRIYHCEECKYFAHVHCVISEIVKVLKVDLKGVEVKALGKDYWVRAAKDELGEPTKTKLKDLIDQLSTHEKRRLEDYYIWDDTRSTDGGGLKSLKKRETTLTHDEEINRILKLSRFDASNFETLMDEFERYIGNERLELKSRDLGLKMVRVKGYMIPYPLADVLKTLLDEYGDIASISDHSLEMKSFVYFILCQTVKRMRATLVSDVTEHLLREWFVHLAFVHFHGFKICFAGLQFERLVDAYLGLRAERLKDEVPKILNAKISEARQKIVEMQLGLEKCNEYRGSSEKSEYMKYCSEKAYESKWGYSFDCSFKDREKSSSIPRKQLRSWM